MRQRGYVIAFVLVLLLACIGGFFGGRLLLARLQEDFGPQVGWTPAPQAGWTPAARLPTAQAGGRPAPTATAGISSTPAPQPTATALVVATPVGGPAAPPASPTPTQTTIASETATPSPMPDISPTPTQAYLYALARPVRYSTGDCPGTYILGQVTDRAGNPLPDVRLYLVDQYGNAATAVSKSGASDAGRYDFPIGGPARRFFLTVIDAGGQQLSPQVEIGYGLAPDPQATCHWVDWRRR